MLRLLNLKLLSGYWCLIYCERITINIGKYMHSMKNSMLFLGVSSHYDVTPYQWHIKYITKHIKNNPSPPQTLTHPGNLVRHLKTTIQLSSDLCSLLIQVVQLLIYREEEVKEVAMLEYSQRPVSKVTFISSFIYLTISSLQYVNVNQHEFTVDNDTFWGFVTIYIYILVWYMCMLI